MLKDVLTLLMVSLTKGFAKVTPSDTIPKPFKRIQESNYSGG